MGSIIALAAAIAGLALFTTAGTAHAAPVTKFQSSKVVHSTPAQVAAVNLKAKAAQSTTTLTVGYGCDQFAVYVAASDHEIASWLNTSGGYGYLGSRFYTRHSPTVLECFLDLMSANGAPVAGCQATVVVAGTDSKITGWQITYRRCY